MINPDYVRLDTEFSSNAQETAQGGYMLDISVNRAAALLDSAYSRVTGNNGKYTVPNGNFSDAECALWELFCKALRAGKELQDEK